MGADGVDGGRGSLGGVYGLGGGQAASKNHA